LTDYAAHRARRLAEVTAPDGWLAVVGQQLLDEGDNEVPDVGVVRLENGVARIGDVVLRDEAIVPFGARTLQLVARAGRVALRVRDPDGPARRAFGGIPTFPLAPEWRRPVRLVGEPRMIETVYTIGTSALVESPGAIELDGARLEPLRMGSRLLLVFGDRTNGRETYGGGRFLWVDEPVTVLDFNLAENPACVFTEHAACPLPAPHNRLAFRVEAGEKYPGA
jgi:uncharacterized protein